MKLEFDICLQRIACNSAGAAIWDKELTNINTQKIFYSGRHSGNRKKWYSLVKDVTKKINQDLLPAVLYRELLSAVMYMGLRIFGWFEHLRKIFAGFGPKISRKDLFENYIKKVYWTHYGTIDELKIFKLFWLNNPNVDICQMYIMACMYCLREEIEAFWGKISKSKQLKFYQNYNIENYDLNILLYWNNYRNPSDSFISQLLLDCNPDVTSIFDAEQSVEENMLKLCALNGNHIGFKYFWDRLDDNKQKNNAVICLKIIMENPYCYEHKDEFDFTYFEDRFYEIFTFLLQNIPEVMATNLILHDSGFPHYRILNCIEYLPWRELLFPVLVDAAQYCDKRIYGAFISEFTKVIGRETAFHLPMEYSGLQGKLKQIWHETPSEQKFGRVHMLIYYLLKAWNLATIKSIVNDKDLIEHKGSLLKTIARAFPFIEINKIEQIFCELLIPRELEENDVNLLKTIYNLLLQKKLSSVDYFLNKCISDDNAKRDLKNKLSLQYIIYYYIENDEFDLADKFLFWALESTEEVNDFKKHLKNDEFAKYYIVDIWSTAKEDFESAISRSDIFLFWLMNYSEAEIYKFKIKMFKEVNLKDFIYRLVIEFVEIRMINQFLVWCLWTDEEIEQFMKILVPKKNRISRLIKPERIEKFKKCFMYYPF